LEERERGNREEGLGWKKGKGQGGMGKTPFFFLPTLPIQNRGVREAGRGSRSAAIAGEPGPGGGQAVGQNDEGLTGNRFPYLPWPVVARGGVFTDGGGLEAASLGGGGVPGSSEGELDLWRCEVR
jgi:hypothetical protein